MEKINLAVDKEFVEMERKDRTQRSSDEPTGRGLRADSKIFSHLQLIAGLGRL